MIIVESTIEFTHERLPLSPPASEGREQTGAKVCNNYGFHYIYQDLRKFGYPCLEFCPFKACNPGFCPFQGFTPLYPPQAGVCVSPIYLELQF